MLLPFVMALTLTTMAHCDAAGWGSHAINRAAESTSPAAQRETGSSKAVPALTSLYERGALAVQHVGNNIFEALVLKSVIREIQMTDLQMLGVSDFEELLNKTFDVTSVSPALQLALIEVSVMGQGARAGGAFSTLWQGPKEPVLDQAIHRLYHKDFGEQDVFLVPVAEKDAGIQYEAVFT